MWERVRGKGGEGGLWVATLTSTKLLGRNVTIITKIFFHHDAIGMVKEVVNV